MMSSKLFRNDVPESELYCNQCKNSLPYCISTEFHNDSHDLFVNSYKMSSKLFSNDVPESELYCNQCKNSLPFCIAIEFLYLTLANTYIMSSKLFSNDVPESELYCNQCKNSLPYCISTGFHIVPNDLTACPNCKFPSTR